jgi:serine/threonine protein kinase
MARIPSRHRSAASMPDQIPYLPTTATLMPLPEASDALPVGSFVGEFEIREVIGVGGFGIVYRAWEDALERDVAIKEYMPMGMVGRNADGHVTLRSPGYREDFNLGLRSFLNEARLLARFDHPALVKVHRFWEAGGTAYMVMPFYKAQTLRQRRQELGAVPVTESWLMSMLEPLLGALAEMHRGEVFHRDIAPDNILWCADNRPVLLDFGAARRVLADRTQHLTAVLKPQFAPIEQYADAQAMRQGPWTDIFALACTCYFMLAGRPPLPATARILSDDLTPLVELAPPGFSTRLLATLDWAMAVRPEDRPQSVAALWDVLHGHASVPERLPPFRVSATPSPATASLYERTIQAPARPDADSATEGPAPDVHGAPTARHRTGTSGVLPGRETESRVARLKPYQWLLGLAILASGAYAMFSNGDTTPVSDPAAANQAPAAASASFAAVLPAGAQLPPAAPNAGQDDIAWASSHEASAAAASMPVRRGASSATRAAATGPRESCIANKAANLDDCVKRVCKAEARFKRSATCLKLQRQAEPWWKIFK